MLSQQQTHNEKKKEKSLLCLLLTLAYLTPVQQMLNDS